MAWLIGTVTVHPDDQGFARGKDALYSRQTALDASSTQLGFFGVQSEEVEMTFKLDEDVNGNVGYTTLEGYVSNANVTITHPTIGSLGNYRLVSFRAVQRQALNHTNAVYDCTARLTKVT